LALRLAVFGFNFGAPNLSEEMLYIEMVVLSLAQGCCT